MYQRTKTYSLEELVKIFIEERNSLREYFLNRTCMFEVTNYLFDLWIEEAEKVTTEEEFDLLIRKSLRMSFQDWLDGIK